MKFIHELNLYSSQIFYKFSISIRPLDHLEVVALLRLRLQLHIISAFFHLPVWLYFV